MNGRAVLPRQEVLVGDREIQMDFLLGPFKACAALKFGWYGIWCPYGEPGIEIGSASTGTPFISHVVLDWSKSLK